jgi:hypothetical protein
LILKHKWHLVFGSVQVETLASERDQLQHEVRKCRAAIQRLQEQAGPHRRSVDSFGSAGTVATSGGISSGRVGELEHELTVCLP